MRRLPTGAADDLTGATAVAVASVIAAAALAAAFAAAAARVAASTAFAFAGSRAAAAAAASAAASAAATAIAAPARPLSVTRLTQRVRRAGARCAPRRRARRRAAGESADVGGGGSARDAGVTLGHVRRVEGFAEGGARARQRALVAVEGVEASGAESVLGQHLKLVDALLRE